MYKNKILMLGLCVVFASWVQAEDSDDSIEQDLTIALTKFDVNDTTLEINWNITNNTDHDVWICDGIGIRYADPSYYDFEIFLAEDLRTLVISWRLAKPFRVIFFQKPDYFGRYVRLRAGQVRTESLSLTLPIGRYILIVNELRYTPYPTRLTLDIGYYDEDLPALILQIVDVARRLNCESIDFEDYGVDYWIFGRYFGGLLIEDTFNKWEEFRESIMSGADEIILPYMIHLNGFGEHILDEQVLRLVVDGVRIPMKLGPYPPTNRESKKTIDEKKLQGSSPYTEKSVGEKQ